MNTYFNPARKLLGAHSKYDGTVEFYGRVRVAISKNSVVVDYGAGRGGWFVDGLSTYTKVVRSLKADVARMIAVDVDEAVFTNQSSHENMLIKDGRVPLPDASVDVIVADYVLEHIDDPRAFYEEVNRLLKPGGVFCARTPHAMNYVSVAARVIRNSRHVAVLKHLQPERKDLDVFPTCYQLNTRRAIRALWTDSEWEDFTYHYTSEPQYYFGLAPFFYALSVLHAIVPSVFTGNMFIFLRKKLRESTN